MHIVLTAYGRQLSLRGRVQCDGKEEIKVNILEYCLEVYLKILLEFYGFCGRLFENIGLNIMEFKFVYFLKEILEKS